MNLSHWPAERIEQLRAVPHGERLLPAVDAVEIVRAVPHGHVLAALATARGIDLGALLPRRAPQRKRDLAFGLIITRIVDPAVKVATDAIGETVPPGGGGAADVIAAYDALTRTFHELPPAPTDLRDAVAEAAD